MTFWMRWMFVLFVATGTALAAPAAEKPSQKKAPLPLYQQQVSKMLQQFFKEQPKLASRPELVQVNALYQKQKDGRPVFWGILYNNLMPEDAQNGKLRSWFQPTSGNHKLQNASRFVTKEDRKRSAEETEKANSKGSFTVFFADPLAKGLIYPDLVEKLRTLPRLNLYLSTSQGKARSIRHYPAFPVKITEQKTVWVSVEQE